MLIVGNQKSGLISMPPPSVNRAVSRALVRPRATNRLHSLSVGAVLLALLVAPNTERADCGNAADRYDAAVAKVMGALHAYATCVSSNAKRRTKGATKGNDCTEEMQALDNAHDDFADAVADAKGCR
jgi:hypothetical protein